MKSLVSQNDAACGYADRRYQPGKGDDVICTAALEDTRKTWLLLLLLVGLHDHYHCRLQFS